MMPQPSGSILAAATGRTLVASRSPGSEPAPARPAQLRGTRRPLDLGGRLVDLAGGWPVQLTSAASGSPAMLPLPMTEP